MGFIGDVASHDWCSADSFTEFLPKPTWDDPPRRYGKVDRATLSVRFLNVGVRGQPVLRPPRSRRCVIAPAMEKII
jgi:hypothetical protein